MSTKQTDQAMTTTPALQWRVYHAQTDVLEPDVLLGEYIIQHLERSAWRNVGYGHKTADEALSAMLASHDELVAACEAAIRYDESICGRAARGKADLRPDGTGIAAGEDLDALYFDWQEKARAALAKAKA